MIQSMTGFAKNFINDNYGLITCEIKTINNRYFDCNLRITDSIRSIEPIVRTILQAELKRGRVDCTLNFVAKEANNISITPNVAMVKKLLHVVKEIGQYCDITKVDPIQILKFPDMLCITNNNMDKIHTIIISLLKETLNDLIKSREKEGLELSFLISDRLDEMLFIIQKIQNLAPNMVSNQRQRLIKRLEEISTLDKLRLEQEMVYFIQKIDSTEEIDRLIIHIKEIKNILKGDKVLMGKRIEFLIQELNRETNTLTAKSIDIKIIQLTVELKVLIEQIREQIQNIL